MPVTRRHLIGTAIAATAFAGTVHAAPARNTTVPYPGSLPRVDANPAYDEPETIGETLEFDHAGRQRRVHFHAPDRDGPQGAILLLHGANRSGRSMLDMWQAAADQSGMVLIAPDAAGDGWSPEADSPNLIIDALNAVAARVKLDTARLVMFGHSSGGMLAQLYANQVPGPWRAIATHGAALPEAAIKNPAVAAVPVRLYTGQKDHLFPPAKARLAATAMASAGHDAELVEIADHTHWYYTIGPWLARDCMDWFALKLAA